MKKIIITLLLLISCSLGTVNNTMKVTAETTNDKIVTVTGYGYVETAPEQVEMNFGYFLKSDTFENAQNEINTKLDNLKNNLKGIDDSVKIEVVYLSCYQNTYEENGYKTKLNISVVSECLDCVDRIINVVNESGVERFYGINYSIKNEGEIYNNVLNNAKLDAEQKVSSMYNTSQFVDMNNLSISTFRQNDKNSVIRVEAVVQSKFQVEEPKTENRVIEENNNQQSENNTNNEQNNTNNENTSNTEVVGENMSAKRPTYNTQNQNENKTINNTERKNFKPTNRNTNTKRAITNPKTQNTNDTNRVMPKNNERKNDNNASKPNNENNVNAPKNYERNDTLNNYKNSNIDRTQTRNNQQNNTRTNTYENHKTENMLNNQNTQRLNNDRTTMDYNNQHIS